MCINVSVSELNEETPVFLIVITLNVRELFANNKKIQQGLSLRPSICWPCVSTACLQTGCRCCFVVFNKKSERGKERGKTRGEEKDMRETDK